MTSGLSFVMAGGGTGGHIIPALAVAQELRRHGHEPFFIGTQRGMEAKLVPAAGFPIEWIEIGGLNRVGLAQRIKSLSQLPGSTMQAMRIMRRRKPKAVFSMGGYVAGPVMMAAALMRIPIVVMEPNAIPGFTNRRLARVVAKALVNFPETARYFPAAEVTGMPVREDFFKLPSREPMQNGRFTLLITGGSQGSKRLNDAARESWKRFAEARLPLRIIHQTGSAMQRELQQQFQHTGLNGEVTAFLDNMPSAFASADLVVCRSGASTVSELAAAGKASVLVPFPFAADDHQLRNAEAMTGIGGARMVLDQEMTGVRLFLEVSELAESPATLRQMSEQARALAKPGAARRAVEVLEQLAMR
jgi:UDP-N-acetylglucosamine--N-acetylmuramyl-(pentapeptide) pyrophosphoryl-undecaprenol N-acetylglucosamine transferase